MASSVHLDIAALDHATAVLRSVASRVDELGDQMRQAAEDAEALAVAAGRAKDNIEELGNRARLLNGSVGSLGREARGAAANLATLAHEAENVSERFRAVSVNIRLAQSALRSLTSGLRTTIAELALVNHELENTGERLRALDVNVRLAQSALRSFTRELRSAVVDVAALAAATQAAVAALGELTVASGAANVGISATRSQWLALVAALVAGAVIIIGPAVLGGIIVVLDLIMGLILVMPGGILGLIAILGTLTLAFDRVGKAIHAGWLGDEKALTKEMSRLTEAQKAFVTSVLGLKPVLKDLQDSLANGILPKLAPILTSISAIMSGPMKQGMGAIANGIGAIANSFAKWATSTENLSEMTRFLKGIGDILKDFAPGTQSFLGVLLKLANFSLPFFDRLVKVLNDILGDWDAWMASTEGSATMTAAMETLAQAFEHAKPLIEAIGKVLVESLADPQTRESIKKLLDALTKLVIDLGPQMPQLVDAFTRWVEVLDRMIPIATKVLYWMGVLSEGAAWWWQQLMDGQEMIFWVIGKIVEGFVWLYEQLVGHSIIPDIVNGIIAWFGKLPGRLGELIGNAVKVAVDRFNEMKEKVLVVVTRMWNDAVSGFQSGVNRVVGVANTVRDRVIGAIEDAARAVFSSGARIVQSIADGMWSRVSAIQAAISSITQMVVDHLPFSPAKVGPLSGSGNPFLSGQSVGRMWAEGMLSARAQVAAAAASMAGQVGGGVALAGVGGGYGGYGDGRASLNIENFIAGGQSPNEIAEALDWTMRGRG